MHKYKGWVTDQQGNALGGTEVTVRRATDSVNATIYSDNGTTIQSNPFTADTDDASFSFYAPNGRYTLVFSRPGYAFDNTDTQDLTIYDPVVGEAIFTGATTTLTITFSNAQRQGDSAYRVLLGQRLVSGTPPGVIARATNYSSTGFNIEISGQAGTGNELAIDWQVERDG